MFAAREYENLIPKNPTPNNIHIFPKIIYFQNNRSIITSIQKAARIIKKKRKTEESLSQTTYDKDGNSGNNSKNRGDNGDNNEPAFPKSYTRKTYYFSKNDVTKYIIRGNAEIGSRMSLRKRTKKT
jgi:hypothetical protein